MVTTPLLLYELLTPFFLLGFRFPDEADQFLSFLAIDELHMASDPTAVVYVGKVQIIEPPGQQANTRLAQPGGGYIEWNDYYLAFRLTVPRDGAQFVANGVTAVDALPTLPGGPPRTPAETFVPLMNQFGAVEGTLAAPTDYPGVRFRLELLISYASFNLGDDWRPGKVDPDTRRIDFDPSQGERVKFVIPKIALEYEQGDDLSVPPVFRLKSWGSVGFDSPADIKQGEIVRMEPPIALHKSGRFAFGIDQHLIDLSQDNTPPEILERFGVDEAFTGLFIKSGRFFYTDKQKAWGFSIFVNDALISCKGEVSLEAGLDIFADRPDLGLNLAFFVNGERYTPVQEPIGTGDWHELVDLDNANQSLVHVEILSGFAPFTITVELRPEGGGAPITLTQVASRPGEYVLTHPPGTVRPTGRYTLFVRATDTAPSVPNVSPRQPVERQIALRIRGTGAPATAGQPGMPADYRPTLPIAGFNGPTTPLPPGYAVTHEGRGDGNEERLRITFPEGSAAPSITVGTTAISLGAGNIARIPVPANNTRVFVNVAFPAIPDGTPLAKKVFFLRDRPLQTDGDEDNYVNSYVTGGIPRGLSNAGPGRNKTYTADAKFREGMDALIGKDAPESHVRSLRAGAAALVGRASFEDRTNFKTDWDLSERRARVIERILNELFTGTDALKITPPRGERGVGHTQATPNATAQQREADRHVEVTLTLRDSPAISTTVSFQRPSSGTTTPTPSSRNVPAPPSPTPQDAPDWLRRLGIRVRLERNRLVMFELSGRIDFDTEMEKRLRNSIASSSGGSLPPATSTSSDLALRNRPGASEGSNTEDGVVDFLINLSFDTSTNLLQETFRLGAAPADLDGLLESPASTTSTFKNIVGALLIFAPILNEVGDRIDDRDTGGDIALMSVSLGIVGAIGAIGIFQVKRITLYGGELRTRQYIPPDGSTAVTFTDAGLIFDYGVETDITLSQLGISWSSPLKVRYKAIGFNINFQEPDAYRPIFDTSKGYEINLADAGRANLPAPLGQILSVLSARIARINPVIFDIDLGLKVNLGFITIDRIKARVTFSDPVAFAIQGAGASVEIPGTLSGRGFVTIVDTVEGGLVQKGFAGQIDLTLISLKLRIAASLSVIAITDTDTGREAVAVYFGLTVEFPAPFPLGQTGIGIYGFSGLFAMHYRRSDLPPAGPPDGISPALKWLIKAGGEPERLYNAAGETLWQPAFDRWSFGIGIVLGTVEGGFLINFRGTFVLELPGPRILIFIKIQIVSIRPPQKPVDNSLSVGILGVLDLDFNLGQITVGVVIDFRIESIIQLTIPIEIFFSLRRIEDWHLYIGTIPAPVTANILNMVMGEGYFMLAGNGIPNFPLRPLPGLAVAVGLGASITFGDVSIGLYLRVAARADMGVSFTPEKYFIVGKISIEGELRLFIISIGASGSLTLEAQVQGSTYDVFVQGEVCGSVQLMFWTVRGCVPVKLGTRPTAPVVPPKLVGKVYLQSFAPVVLAGQGSDRPIDASLGDAAGDATAGATVIVPVDSVIVVQMGFAPALATAPSLFTSSPGVVAGPPDYTYSLGDGVTVRYVLDMISLSPGLAAGTPVPPSVWRWGLINPLHSESPTNPPAQSAATQVSLALFSRTPSHAARALERSTTLTTQVEDHIQRTCTPIAPPACVLWTFCGQPLGPSGDGWDLWNGTAWPDPPGTRRDSPPPTHLRIDEQGRSSQEQTARLFADSTIGKAYHPALIVGYNPFTGDDGNNPSTGGNGGHGSTSEKRCINFANSPDKLPNPLVMNGETKFTTFAQGALVAENRVDNASGRSLNAQRQLMVEIPPSRRVELTVRAGSNFKINALDDRKQVVAKVKGGSSPVDQTHILDGQGAHIVLVQIDAPANELWLAEICYVAVNGKPDIQETDADEKPCLDFANITDKEIANPYRMGRITLTVLPSTVRETTPTRLPIRTIRGVPAVGLSGRVRIDMPDTFEVTGEILNPNSTIQISAFDADGTIVDKITLKAESDPQSFTLTSASDIRTVEIRLQRARLPVPIANTPLAFLLRLCYTPQDELQGTTGQPNANAQIEQLPANIDPACVRALQLPLVREGATTSANAELSSVGQSMISTSEAEIVIFQTGRAERIALLVAASQTALATTAVRQLDTTGATVATNMLGDFPRTTVNTLADLPGEWSNASGPWRQRVDPVLVLFGLRAYRDLKVWYIEFQPDEETKQLAFINQTKPDSRERVLIGAVQVCPMAEALRAQAEEAVRENEIRTVNKYLAGGDLVPLLAPDTAYALTVGYRAIVNNRGTETTSTLSETFHFKTDNQPPARLDSYILGSTPHEADAFHFFDDPIKVVFNDLSIIQLYRTYNRNLRMVLRSADGRPVDYTDPDTGERTGDTHVMVDALDAIDGAWHSPFRDTLVQTVERGDAPCIEAPPPPQQGSFTLHANLRPNMNYTLDIELVDATTDALSPVPPRTAAVGAPPAPVAPVPLFRKQFRTSRYRSMDELAALMSGVRPTHRALTTAITFAGTEAVLSASDLAISDALRAAGEQALPAADGVGCTIYWTPGMGGVYVPHAILIDPPEPVWRWRAEPTLERVPNQSDANFKMVIPGRAPSLHVVEMGGSFVSRIVHSTGGTRTLCFLRAGAAGNRVQIGLTKPPSTLYKLDVETVSLLNLTLGARAPWQEEVVYD